MKRKIIVIYCISSSLNYIEDIRREGYEPVIMEITAPQEIREYVRKALDVEYSYIKGEKPLVVQECSDYHQTLRMVREMNPVLVIAGGDLGLKLASKLSHDLGLPGHRVERLPYLRRKDKMHEALKDAGLRYIRGKVVSSVEEGIEFYENELNGKSAIVKPLDGGGSVGVMACHSRGAVAEALRRDFADSGTALVQEMINGTEYYVNTVTFNGRTVVTNVCRYDKVQVGDMRPVYVKAVSLSPADETLSPMIRYVIEALDAVGLEIGPAHTEVMLDEKGPVLIEVNARLAGGHQPSEWQDLVLGIHESEIALRAYLGKDIFESGAGVKAGIMTADGIRCYPLRSNGLWHPVFISREMEAKDNPIVDIVLNMASYHSHKGLTAPSHYDMTIDLSNSGGTIYMTHPDAAVLESDFADLLDLELNHIEQLFTD